MTTAIISHPDCFLHNAGPGHPEQPDRVKVIQHALLHYPFNAPVTFHEAPLAEKSQLLLVHDANYIDWLAEISPQENSIAIDADTLMNPFTLTAAYRAAGAVPFAVDLDAAQSACCILQCAAAGPSC